MTDNKVNKKTFNVELDGKEVEIAVIRPDHRVAQKAGTVYAKAYIEAVNDGVPVQEYIEKTILVKLLDQEKQDRYMELFKRLNETEKQLAKGSHGLYKTKAQARQAAIQMRRDRYELRQLTSERNRYLTNTAEAFAEQAKFNFLVVNCTVYGNNKEKYFKDVDDYLSRDNEDPVAGKAAVAMSTIAYPLDDEYEKNLAENKLLVKYGFVDERLRLVDPKNPKQLVDADLKPINDNGDWINEKGEVIDSQGNVIAEDGSYKFDDFQEFLDEEAEPEAPAAA